MTLEDHNDAVSECLYSIKQTESRGRAVFASKWIRAETTVHIASQPYVAVIKEEFKKETCAWCFKYQHGKASPIKHPDAQAGLWFCSVECSQAWTKNDYDGKLSEALSSLRTPTARKVRHLSL
jgi:hypothetical protein